MGSNTRNPRIVYFGDCVLDLDTSELCRNGKKTSLQSQPFQILTALLENPGQLVTREQLTQRLWPTGTFVDFDQSLNKAVARLREALGDNAEVMEATGENARKLVGNELESYGGFSWSPTGRRLAYVKTKLDGSSRVIETVSLDGEPPSVVLSDPGLLEARQMVGSLAWLHDGRMIFVLEKSLRDNLWEIRVDPQTGKPTTSTRQMTNWDKWDALSLSVSRDDQRLLVEKLHVRQDIYVGALKENGTRLDALKRLSFSDSENLVFGWSPDGKANFFKSDRTGVFQSYQQKLDQEDGERLNAVGGWGGSTVVSPDGRSILHWSSHGGTDPSRLMRLPVSQGAPQQVLEFPAGEVADFDCPQRAISNCVLYRSEKDQLIFYELNPLYGLGKELKRFKLKLSSPSEFALSPDGMLFAIVPRVFPGHRMARGCIWLRATG